MLSNSKTSVNSSLSVSRRAAWAVRGSNPAQLHHFNEDRRWRGQRYLKDKKIERTVSPHKTRLLFQRIVSYFPKIQKCTFLLTQFFPDFLGTTNIAGCTNLDTIFCTRTLKAYTQGLIFPIRDLYKLPGRRKSIPLQLSLLVQHL